MKENNNCTGAIEKSGEELAYYRLLKSNGNRFFAISMDNDQLSERRIFLRKALAPYPRWENLSNEQLEDIRLYRVNNGYMAEDEKGCQFYLPGQNITTEDHEFRKVRAMMPFEFVNAVAKDFIWSKYKSDIMAAKDMVNRYIMFYQQFKDSGMGLYIYSGTKGSGKTMLSCCILNEISKRHAGSVKFVNILDFLEMTKKSYDGDESVKALYEASLLVIDDIGVQMSKEWIDTVLYRLINERYANRLPTIYTSNIPVDRLKMDDRIIDRIESTTFTVTIPEEAIRKEIRQQEKEKLLQKIINAPSGATNTRQGDATINPSQKTDASAV